MSTFYGSDTACVSDIPLIDVQTSDPFLVIGQRIARRLQTPRGALAIIGDDPTFGFDVRQLVNGRVAPTQVSQYQQLIAAECTKDEEVSAADVSLTFAPATGALTVAIQLTSSAGPFQLTLDVSGLTVTAVFNF